MEKRASAKALIPFGIFVGIYLITGIVLSARGVDMAFYQLPSPVAAIVGIIVAFLLFQGKTEEKLETFMKGCGNENIIIMCLIFLLAGAFSAVSSEMGGVDAVVSLGMAVMPPQFVAAGVFVISAFISTATGTSVGTAAAVTSIALGLAEASGVNQYLIVGATIGGAMFGDNLSMISDTTIAATRTQGTDMKDKFRANFAISLPAALITIVLLVMFGRPDVTPKIQEYSFNIVKVMPYVFVLVAALVGINVFIVLTGGIIFSGIIGIAMKSFTVLEFANHVYSGFTGMFEIFLLSMLMGGLAAMVEKEGGIEWILQKIKKVIKNEKTAELGIAAMVALTDAAAANNTVAILINGPVAKEISEEYGIEPKRSASLLDIFSCIVQGLIPYGAQILMACALIENLDSPFQVIEFCWYQYVLAVVAVIAILVPHGKKVRAKKDK